VQHRERALCCFNCISKYKKFDFCVGSCARCREHDRYVRNEKKEKETSDRSRFVSLIRNDLFSYIYIYICKQSRERYSEGFLFLVLKII
jgi:hypothetical protein